MRRWPTAIVSGVLLFLLAPRSSSAAPIFVEALLGAGAGAPPSEASSMGLLTLELDGTVGWYADDRTTYSATLSGMEWPCFCATIPEATLLESESWSVVISREWGGRPGRARMLSVGLGAGRIRTEGHVALDPPAVGRRDESRREVGPALALEFGQRWLPRPGPIGLAVRARAHAVVARHSSVWGATILFGLAVHPQGPRTLNR